MKRISHPSDVIFRDLLLTIRLFEGETLLLKPLAEEYGVTVRTLQRDFAQRLAPVLGDRLQKSPENGGYFLALDPDDRAESLALGVLERFSESVGGRFYRHAHTLFRRMRHKGPFWIVSNMEDISHKEAEVWAIKEAIDARTGVGFDYVDKEGKPGQKTVFPLLFLNAQGIWYLLAWSEEKTKTYALSNISCVKSAKAKAPPIDLKPVIEGAVNIWFTTETPPFEARFWVDKTLTYHFDRQPISKHQRLYESHANGDKIYTIPITDHRELLPTLKQFIPHVLPLHPPGLVADFEAALKSAMDLLGNVEKS